MEAHEAREKLVKTCAVAAPSCGLTAQSGVTLGQLVESTLLVPCPGSVGGFPVGTRCLWLSTAAARLREAHAPQEGQEPLTLR